ncbi:hypothetical protein JCM19241_1544 [Vibrio ishigakensis]|uniref:DUF58 domain-containing protein n=1 Tax=Vibrio ishigakensis TaxID=1481914 RepID=A0A0B8Q9A8_9VIBR|nr:hypothetical protein JCM19241_1544 [Vibrio ishigakensis]
MPWQSQAVGLSFLPQLKSGTVLSGRHQSLFRGRGLNFEELRHYQKGDDIRNLDWKVTLRTGKPHVRSYTEEKDRNVLLCIDQSASMFFASNQVMKSVVAAEVAALSGWSILSDNDRVGISLRSSKSIQTFKSQRSRGHLLHALKSVHQANHSLSVGSTDSEEVSMSHWLASIERMASKNTTIVIISDWLDIKEADLDKVKQLQIHNDLLAVRVSDPMEKTIPSSNWVMGDGELQLSITEESKITKANLGLEAHHNKREEQLTRLMAIKNLPFVQLDTSGEHIQEYKCALGGRR